jgi:hypothetical protein
MTKLRSARPLALVVSAVVLLVVAVGAAFGASGGGSLHACANKTNGALRLAAHCKRSEKGASWSFIGPPGPQGVQGRQGTQGA